MNSNFQLLLFGKLAKPCIDSYFLTQVSLQKWLNTEIYLSKKVISVIGFKFLTHSKVIQPQILLQSLLNDFNRLVHWL